MHRSSVLTRCLKGLLTMTVLAGLAAPGLTADKKIKVLLCTGDWKSQPYYQNVVMAKDGKPSIFRGRFIIQEVEKVAPGKFEWTDIPNYIGQEHIDADYLSQFDVVLLGDIMGHFPEPWQKAINEYVKNGGGLIYCANHKWGIAQKYKGMAFEQCLPCEYPAADEKGHWAGGTGEGDFKAEVAAADHPVVKGLDWAGAPTLNNAVNMPARSNATVLLKTPKGAPVLTAWEYGKGRSIFSASIFANDEMSEKFGSTWKDFGKYYAQVFTWLGEKSTNTKAALKDTPAEISVTVDFNKPLNTVSPGIFSIHGNESVHGLALTNYMALNPKGAIYRHGVGIESEGPDGADINSFNWDAMKKELDVIDAGVAEAKSYGCEMDASFQGLSYGAPKWLWKDNGWGTCTEKQAAEVAKMFAAVVEHVNKGKGTDKSYQLNVKYVELGNEPDLNETCIAGYIQQIKAIGSRLHRDYPGVRLIVYCPSQPKFIEQLCNECGKDFDALSFHPYGWTLDVLFPFLQSVEDRYVKATGKHVELIITEWDFWVQGRQKFDYMMRRNYWAVKAPDLTGAIHYRMWQYSEPIYQFGVMYCYDPKTAGQPMHDAYDAFWTWKDFRGQRVDTQTAVVSKNVTDKLLKHIYADSAKGEAGLNTVLYYDWSYDGTGFKDYTKGANYAKVKVHLKMLLPEGLKGKKLTISQATGEGFSDLKKDVELKDGQKEFSDTVEIAPLTGITVSIK